MKRIASILALLTLAACGGDGTTGPSGPPVPTIAGKYNNYPTWLVQWARQRDGVTGSFTCDGSITLSQSEAVGGAAALSGFLVVGHPCPPQSFDLTGIVRADGSISFKSNGPKPPEGQCPQATGIDYAGVVTTREGSSQLSARASTLITCPGPGEGPQRMDYILSGYRY